VAVAHDGKLRRRLVNPLSRSANSRSKERRASGAVVTASGILATAALVYVFYLFGAAADANFLPSVFRWGGAYVVMAALLYTFKFDRLAMLVAWLPVLLLFLVLPAIGDFARWFGVRQ